MGTDSQSTGKGLAEFTVLLKLTECAEKLLLNIRIFSFKGINLTHSLSGFRSCFFILPFLQSILLEQDICMKLIFLCDFYQVTILCLNSCTNKM